MLGWAQEAKICNDRSEEFPGERTQGTYSGKADSEDVGSEHTDGSSYHPDVDFL